MIPFSKRRYFKLYMIPIFLFSSKKRKTDPYLVITANSRHFMEDESLGLKAKCFFQNINISCLN